MSGLLVCALLSLGEQPVVSPAAVLLPQSGPLAPLAGEFLDGFVLGFGRENDFMLLDTRSDANEAASLASSLASNGSVLLAVGPVTSEASIKAADAAVRGGLPLLLPTAEDLRLGSFGSRVFPFNYAHYLQTAQSVRFGLAKFGSRWALVYPDNGFGNGVARFFRSLAETSSVDIVYDFSFDPLQSEFQEMASVIANRGADVVFIPGGGRGAAFLFLQLKKKWLKAPVLGLDPWFGADAREWVSGALKGLWVVSLKRPSVLDEMEARAALEAFKQRFTEEYDRAPSDIAMRGYDAGVIAKKVLRDAKSREEVEAALLNSGVFQGVSGPILLDKRAGYLAVYMMKKGEYVAEEFDGEEEGSEEEGREGTGG